MTYKKIFFFLNKLTMFNIEGENIQIDAYQDKQVFNRTRKRSENEKHLKKGSK